MLSQAAVFYQKLFTSKSANNSKNLRKLEREIY